MKKTELLILLGSLLVTCLFSTIFGFAGSAIIGTFWGWFWISLLIQIIGFAMWNSFSIHKQNALAQQAEIQTLELLSKFVVNLTCSYCKHKNGVPIQLNRKNTFKCDSCSQVNSVQMQFSAAALTTPVESVKFPVGTESVAEFKVSR